MLEFIGRFALIAFALVWIISLYKAHRIVRTKPEYAHIAGLPTLIALLLLALPVVPAVWLAVLG